MEHCAGCGTALPGDLLDVLCAQCVEQAYTRLATHLLRNFVSPAFGEHLLWCDVLRWVARRHPQTGGPDG
jgi:hypothetical protein